MSENIAITLSREEALVLFEFFSRFAEKDDFTLRHNAEYLAFSRISAQLDKALVEPLQPDYSKLLHVARNRIAAGYQGRAPGVSNETA
jgi:pyoverdine/dityrosine biosynthesis protein Dit1